MPPSLITGKCHRLRCLLFTLDMNSPLLAVDEYTEKSLIIPPYKAIVRPHLEYCIQARNPHLRKDVDMLEKIQRRATKPIPELRDLT